MYLVPEKHKSTDGRSLEVTKTYLHRGQSVTRSLWVKVSPKHPLLKVVMAAPMAALFLTMLVLFVIVLGFTLLAMAFMQTMGGMREKDDDAD